MQMPGANRAVVDASKVRHYLLCAAHPVGQSKAAYFSFEGRPASWERTIWMLASKSVVPRLITVVLRMPL